MTAELYVLHGHWETENERGVGVVEVSFIEGEVISRLNKIADNKASEYCIIDCENLEIEHRGTVFEMRDMDNGDFVGFYVTKHILEMPDSVMEEIDSCEKHSD